MLAFYASITPFRELISPSPWEGGAGDLSFSFDGDLFQHGGRE
jgi:hypothetical protein